MTQGRQTSFLLPFQAVRRRSFVGIGVRCENILRHEIMSVSAGYFRLRAKGRVAKNSHALELGLSRRLKQMCRLSVRINRLDISVPLPCPHLVSVGVQRILRSRRIQCEPSHVVCGGGWVAVFTSQKRSSGLHVDNQAILSRIARGYQRRFVAAQRNVCRQVYRHLLPFVPWCNIAPHLMFSAEEPTGT